MGGINNGVQIADTLKHKTDIIMLQEHWLYPSTIERFNNNNDTHEVFAIFTEKMTF